MASLKSKYLRLSTSPNHGCRWLSLKTRLNNRWVELLDTKAGGLFLMAPWCNRIKSAQFSFEGKTHRLRSNLKDGSAIHGDVRNRRWRVKKKTARFFRATLDSREVTDFNFPFAMKFEHIIRLTDNALSISLSAKNMSSSPAPIGLGFHPFFRRSLRGERDRLKIEHNARKVYPANGPYPIGPAKATNKQTFTDHCLTGLSKNRPIKLNYPQSQMTLEWKGNAQATHVYVYSPKTHEGKKASFVCVEPMTHVPFMFNLMGKKWSGMGDHVLKPGQRLKIAGVLQRTHR